MIRRNLRIILSFVRAVASPGYGDIYVEAVKALCVVRWRNEVYTGEKPAGDDSPPGSAYSAASCEGGFTSAAKMTARRRQ